MWTVISPIIGTVLGYGFRHVLGLAKWSAITAFAKSIMEDPKKTNDPRQAVIEAMITAQMAELTKTVKKVEDAFTPKRLDADGTWKD
jgi:hypothetical protein